MGDCEGEVDRVYEDGRQDVFVVKIEKRPETCGFVAGAYYKFLTQYKSGDWKEIMTFRHDDPIDPSSKNIQIINERIAVVSMGWKAAVTSDSGKTWNLWDAQSDLPNWKAPNYFLIDEITMSQHGEGKMVLDPIQNRNEPKELVTSDFGKTWTPID